MHYPFTEIFPDDLKSRDINQWGVIEIDWKPLFTSSFPLILVASLKFIVPVHTMRACESVYCLNKDVPDLGVLLRWPV